MSVLRSIVFERRGGPDLLAMSDHDTEYDNSDDDRSCLGLGTATKLICMTRKTHGEIGRDEGVCKNLEAVELEGEDRRGMERAASSRQQAAGSSSWRVRAQEQGRRKHMARRHPVVVTSIHASSAVTSC